MSNSGYIILNGTLLQANHPVLTADNRSFRFGDAVFETMRYHKGITLFFDDHYNRLLQGMSVLKMNITSLASPQKLTEHINTLIIKNSIYRDARLRLTVFRNAGGLYTPGNNDVSFILEATPLNRESYSLNDKGLLTGVFREYKKQSSPLFRFKNANSLLYVLAGIYKKEHHFDDCLIVNEDNKIIEAISSNLFWIKHETVFTPFISSGCVDGIMRKQVIKAIRKAGLHFQETGGTDVDELLNADELFLTNAIQGIKWIMGLEQKRFYNLKTKHIHGALIEDIRLMTEKAN